MVIFLKNGGLILKKIFKNEYIFSLITKLSLVFFGMLNTILITRYLGPELKGQHGYILNIVNILVLILNLGIYQSFPFNKRRNIKENLINSYYTVFIVQFILYLSISLIIAFFTNNTELILVFILVPTMVLVQQLQFISMVENVNLRNIISIGNEIFYTLLLIIIYLSTSPNIYFIFIALFLKDLVIISRFIYSYRLKFEFKEMDRKFILETLQYGFYPMLTGLLLTLNYRLDVILLRNYVSFSQIGLYTVGVGLADKIWIIPDAFKDVLFSKATKKDSIADLTLSIKINLVICLLLLFVIVSFGEFLIKILYGIEFIQAYSVTVIILVGIIPMMFYKLIYTQFIADGKQKTPFFLLLLSVLANLIGNYILIPLYGINGAAIASVISYAICGFLFLIIFMYTYNIRLSEILFFKKEEMYRLRFFKK